MRIDTWQLSFRVEPKAASQSGGFRQRNMVEDSGFQELPEIWLERAHFAVIRDPALN
jgi:hypothetical protein